MNYYVRLQDEIADVQNKLSKLQKFISTGGAPTDELNLLKVQADIMSSYLRILHTRAALIKQRYPELTGENI